MGLLGQWHQSGCRLVAVLLGSFLESTGTIYGVVISGYFVKSGAENYTKIREYDYYGNPRNQKYPDQNETEVNGSI